MSSAVHDEVEKHRKGLLEVADALARFRFLIESLNAELVATKCQLERAETALQATAPNAMWELCPECKGDPNHSCPPYDCRTCKGVGRLRTSKGAVEQAIHDAMVAAENYHG